MMDTVELCSHISSIAYQDNPRPALLGLDTGFELVRKYDVGGTQAILVTNYQVVVFAPRGTEPDEWQDWLTDLAYIKTDFPGGGRVHQGFYFALMKIWDAVEADLNDLAYPKIYTGHSLGAAMALEAAVLRPPRETHVFGCPRVGNAEFARRIPKNTTRHENWLDLVTLIPPPISPWQIRHAMRHGREPTLYTHGGKQNRLRGIFHSIHRYEKATSGKS